MFQNRNYNLQKRLSDVLPSQQSHQILYRTTCCVGCGNLSDFPLQYCTLIALVFGRGVVARMSIHDQAPHLTVKRLGHVDSYYMSPFFCKVRSYVIPEVHNIKD